MITQLKTVSDYFANKNFKILIVLFIPFLILFSTLVLDPKIGVLILLGGVVFLTVLLKPKLVYFLLLALFSVEGFTNVPGASYATLLGILLVIGLTLRLLMTKNPLPKDSSYKYLLLILAGSLISFVHATDLPTSLRFYITFTSLFLFYGMTRYFMRSIGDIHTGLDYLFFSTLLIFIMVQAMGLSVRGHASTRISGGIGDPNEFASFILVLLPLSYYRAMSSAGVRRIAYWICVMSFMALSVYTGSRGGILGFLGAAVVLSYHYSIGRLRQLFFLILIAATILVLAVPSDFWSRASTILHPGTSNDLSIDVRLTNYHAALKMFLDYPLTGAGLRNFQFRAMEYGAFKNDVVHDSYLEVLTGGGLLCFIPFLLIILDSWRKLSLRRINNRDIRDLLICLKASLISLLITSFFISVENKKIMWFLFALISSTYYLTKNQRILHQTRNSSQLR
jgi:O-antigen ligase